MSFASEADDDDNGFDENDHDESYGLVNLFSGNDTESLVANNDSSSGHNDTEFISISMDETSADGQNESELAANNEAEQKIPLNDVEMDATCRAALHSIFGKRPATNVGTAAETDGEEAADLGNNQRIEMDRSGTYNFYLKSCKLHCRNRFLVYIGIDLRSDQGKDGTPDDNANVRSKLGASSQCEYDTGDGENTNDSASTQNDDISQDGK